MIDNEGLFIKVYISRITWDKNPKNFDIYDITKFKIYRKLSSQPEGSYVLLGEVPASGALEYEDEFSTWEDRDKHVYAVTSMSIEGRESEKAAAFFSASSPKANMSLNSVQKRLIRK